MNPPTGMLQSMCIITFSGTNRNQNVEKSHGYSSGDFRLYSEKEGWLHISQNWHCIINVYFYWIERKWTLPQKVYWFLEVWSVINSFWISITVKASLQKTWSDVCCADEVEIILINKDLAPSVDDSKLMSWCLQVSNRLRWISWFQIGFWESLHSPFLINF